MTDSKHDEFIDKLAEILTSKPNHYAGLISEPAIISQLMFTEGTSITELLANRSNSLKDLLSCEPADIGKALAAEPTIIADAIEVNAYAVAELLTTSHNILSKLLTCEPLALDNPSVDTNSLADFVTKILIISAD